MVSNKHGAFIFDTDPNFLTDFKTLKNPGSFQKVLKLYILLTRLIAINSVSGRIALQWNMKVIVVMLCAILLIGTLIMETAAMRHPGGPRNVIEAPYRSCPEGKRRDGRTGRCVKVIRVQAN
ncbi:hypothetical protein GE061_012653 [Apolygus lucorum]|uniref:Uncharacterized protein n=1 Tax=Apolygus lucorum TaxID=248454 RepID=A0A8S9XSX0_APOLU|nr:hypothetical protein GE061_012653 [Apolygus lucorum]